MRLRALRRHWNEYGRSDPLWAILTARDKKGNRWSIDEFLQTGRDEIDALIRYLDERGLAKNRRRALDFGCGAGRLTHALAGGNSKPRVPRQHIRPARVDHVQLRRPGLHASRAAAIRPRYVRQYLAEFVRVLTPGGVLIFQLPSDAVPPVKVEGHPLKRLLPRPLIAAIRAVRRLRDFPRMELHGLPRQQVEQLLAGLGAPVVDVVDDRAHSPDTPGFRTAPSNSGGNGGAEETVSHEERRNGDERRERSIGRRKAA